MPTPTINHNKSASRYGAVIFARAAQGAPAEKALEAWLKRAIENIQDWLVRLLGWPGHDERVIIKFVTTEYEETALDQEGAEGEPYAKAVAVAWWGVGAQGLHRAKFLDREELLVSSEPRQGLNLGSKWFAEEMEATRPTECCLEAVGVSLLDKDMIKAHWNEVCEECRSTMKGKGRGSMQHPMWVRDPLHVDSAWHSVRETSFNFGW